MSPRRAKRGPAGTPGGEGEPGGLGGQPCIPPRWRVPASCPTAGLERGAGSYLQHPPSTAAPAFLPQGEEEPRIILSFGLDEESGRGIFHLSPFLVGFPSSLLAGLQQRAASTCSCAPVLGAIAKVMLAPGCEAAGGQCQSGHRRHSWVTESSSVTSQGKSCRSKGCSACLGCLVPSLRALGIQGC